MWEFDIRLADNLAEKYGPLTGRVSLTYVGYGTRCDFCGVRVMKWVEITPQSGNGVAYSCLLCGALDVLFGETLAESLCEIAYRVDILSSRGVCVESADFKMSTFERTWPEGTALVRDARVFADTGVFGKASQHVEYILRLPLHTQRCLHVLSHYVSQCTKARLAETLSDDEFWNPGLGIPYEPISEKT